MPRVIQDSDDEGDLSEGSPVRKEVDHAAMAPPRTSEKPTSASTTSVTGTNSSGQMVSRSEVSQTDDSARYTTPDERSVTRYPRPYTFEKQQKT
jgi:hypothetical protein